MQGAGCDYVNGTQQCDDCQGSRVIEKGYWDGIRVITRSKTKEQILMEELTGDTNEELEEYFQQHPEERKQRERVRPENVRWEYELNTDYSEAFPEHLGRLIELHPDWWYWRKHNAR